jgi:hypothetical protein
MVGVASSKADGELRVRVHLCVCSRLCRHIVYGGERLGLAAPPRLAAALHTPGWKHNCVTRTHTLQGTVALACTYAYGQPTGLVRPWLLRVAKPRRHAIGPAHSHIRTIRVRNRTTEYGTVRHRPHGRTCPCTCAARYMARRPAPSTADVMMPATASARAGGRGSPGLSRPCHGGKGHV